MGKKKMPRPYRKCVFCGKKIKLLKANLRTGEVEWEGGILVQVELPTECTHYGDYVVAICNDCLDKKIDKGKITETEEDYSDDDEKGLIVEFGVENEEEKVVEHYTPVRVATGGKRGKRQGITVEDYRGYE